MIIVLDHFHFYFPAASPLIAIYILGFYTFVQISKYSEFVRCYQWNCTKSCSSGGDVSTLGICPGPALLATGTRPSTQSHPWGRCHCGKDFSYFYPTFASFFLGYISLLGLLQIHLLRETSIHCRFWKDKECFQLERRSWVSHLSILMWKTHWRRFCLNKAE